MAFDDTASTTDCPPWARDLRYRGAHLAVEGAIDGLRQVDPRYSKQSAREGATSYQYKVGFAGGWAAKALIGGAGAVGISGLPIPL